MTLPAEGPIGAPPRPAHASGTAAAGGAVPGGPATVLVVDDLAELRHLLERLLTRDGHAVVTAADGEQALALVPRVHPDVILADVRMPNRDGFSLCAAIKGQADTRLIPVVLITGLADAADRLRAMDAGADDFLTKPVDPAELRARVRSLVRLKRFTDDLESAEAVLRSLALTIEARDPYTRGHCERLARYATALGAALGLVEEDLTTLARGGYFHDLGKIRIPDAILLKPGPLTRDEYGQVMEHTVIGEHLCGGLRVLRRVRPIVRHHHERLDGTGYPDGLRGDAVPLLAQIVGIVDIFDAMTSRRPYREALPVDTACEALADEARRGWRRRDLVDRFVELAAGGHLRPVPEPGP